MTVNIRNLQGNKSALKTLSACLRDTESPACHLVVAGMDDVEDGIVFSYFGYFHLVQLCIKVYQNGT